MIIQYDLEKSTDTGQKDLKTSTKIMSAFLYFLKPHKPIKTLVLFPVILKDSLENLFFPNKYIMHIHPVPMKIISPKIFHK